MKRSASRFGVLCLFFAAGRWVFLAPIVWAMFSAGASGQILTGTVNWTDPQNVLHPARRHRVEVYGVAGGFLHVARAYTNLMGNYQAVYAVPPGGFLVTVARPQADTGLSPGGGFVFPQDMDPVRPPAAVGLFFGDSIYNVEGATGGTGGVINFDLPRFDTEATINAAFSISDALYTGWYYSSQVRPAGALEIEANFPTTQPTSVYDNKSLELNILNDDAFDWDVILHEYGHYLADIDGMQDRTGIVNVNHSFGVSNINAANGKLGGTHQAWSEGLASYLGIAAQNLNAAAQNLPATAANGIGNTRFQDTVDQMINVDLESFDTNGANVRGVGEGDELSVGRVLWDLADAVGGAAEPFDRIALGHVALYGDLNNSIPGIEFMDDVWKYYYGLSNDAQRKDYGAIFEADGISPRPTGSSPINVSLLSQPDPPTFEWERRNNNANDTFQLIVFNSDFSQRVLDIAISGDVTSYTLIADEWNTLRGTLGDYRFIIAGSDNIDPLTSMMYDAELRSGAYWSDAYAFAIIPEPAASILASWAVALCMLHRRR